MILYFIFINIYSIFIIQFMVSFILTYIELYSLYIIYYMWLTPLSRKTFRAWEDDIYPSYAAARAALDCEESPKEVKKEDLKATVKYDNLQNDKSINDDLSVVSVSPEIEIDSCQAVDGIKVVKDDIMTANITCNDIEQRVNYLEKELSKDKKKYSKLIRLGIACLFGG